MPKGITYCKKNCRADESGEDTNPTVFAINSDNIIEAGFTLSRRTTIPRVLWNEDGSTEGKGLISTLPASFSIVSREDVTKEKLDSLTFISDWENELRWFTGGAKPLRDAQNKYINYHMANEADDWPLIMKVDLDAIKLYYEMRITSWPRGAGSAEDKWPQAQTTWSRRRLRLSSDGNTFVTFPSNWLIDT